VPSISRVTCGDDYTKAATLRDVWTAAGGWLTVATNSAILQLQYGHSGDDLWTDEQQLDPGAFATLPPTYCTGARFRNAVAGQNAVVGVTFAQGGAALGARERPVEPILAISAMGAVVTVPSKTVTSGQSTTNAGTRKALANTSTPILAVVVEALKANTGLAFIGGSSVASGTGYQLQAGQAVALGVADLATVFFDVAVNGEGVAWLAIV
jgi:hypothetical protein